ncbi:MAG: NADH-quinone oxidoreductase subunit B family protein [bacterium]
MQLIISSIDFVYNWARSNSVWPLTFATSCCGIEMISTSASSFDIARFGSEVFRATPRQADLIITAGTITHKMAPALLRLYEQMPEPKYVIAMGACTITGGMYENDSYSVVKGVDRILPVDVYIPGCPPRPEALLEGIMKLQKQIRTETILDRQKYIEAHRPKLKLSPNSNSDMLLALDGMEIYTWGIQKDGYKDENASAIR